MNLQKFSNTTLELVDINIKFALSNGTWLNVTEVVKEWNSKHPTNDDLQLQNYWNSVDTKEYMEAVSNLKTLKSNDLKIAKRGNNGGTYIHPDLVIHFGR